MLEECNSYLGARMLLALDNNYADLLCVLGENREIKLMGLCLKHDYAGCKRKTSKIKFSLKCTLNRFKWTGSFSGSETKQIFEIFFSLTFFLVKSIYLQTSLSFLVGLTVAHQGNNFPANSQSICRSSGMLCLLR